MPSLPQHPHLPPEPKGDAPVERWGVSFQRAFQRLWTSMVYVLNALCKVDTLANRSATPTLNETFFVASDTDQTFVGVAGAWKEVGRVNGTSGGAIPFTEITDPAAPSTNAARLYVRDSGAGKTQLCCRFASGAVQVSSANPRTLVSNPGPRKRLPGNPKGRRRMMRRQGS